MRIAGQRTFYSAILGSMLKRADPFVVMLFLASLLGIVQTASATEYYVGSTADDTSGTSPCDDVGDLCTIRQAITLANADVSGTTLTIHIPSGTYNTASVYPNILKTMTIKKDASDPGTTTIDGNSTDRIFVFDAAAVTLTIENLSIQDGKITVEVGGCIDAVNGNLVIDNCTFTDCDADYGGGAIYLGGASNTLSVTDSTFTSNAAVSTNSGGAIRSMGSTTIDKSTFTSNTSVTSGGAVYIDDLAATLVVTSSTFTQNTTGNNGGGAIRSRSTASIAVSVTGCNFDQNTSAASGGAIISSGRVQAKQSTFSNNTATNGGAIQAAGLEIANCTFSENSATTNGGAIDHVTSPNCTIRNTTFYNNVVSATYRGASIANSGTCLLANNIYQHNLGSTYNNCRNTGTITSEGYNLDNANTSCWPNPAPGTDSLTTAANLGLGVLADNGGLTPTHAITDTSSAYNSASDAICQGSDVDSIDQRGKSRLITQCDVGAYEYVPNTAPIGGYTAENVIPAAQVVQATDGTGNITITWKGKDDETDNVTLHTFKYSVDGGSTWSLPVSGDASVALSTDWDDNGGSGYTTADNFGDAATHSFTLNTKHATELTGLAAVDQSDVRVKFYLYDGELNSASPVNSESFRVDNEPPTCTITSASYKPSTDTLTITGTNFLTMAVADTNVETVVDWTKFKWDINGDDGTTDDITFEEADVQCLTVTNDTTLTLVFTSTKADDAIEATAGYSNFGGADTLDVSAGFCIDEFGNIATTDAKANAPLTISEPVFAVTKTSAVYSDPISGTSNPKRIPGSLIDYTITVTNGGDGSPDADSTVITDEIDATTLWLYVNSAPASAVTFTDGTTSSALALDAITYSDEAAPGPYAYDYTPSGEFDGLVTSLKVTTTGSFAYGGSPLPSFSLEYRVKVK